MSQGPRTVNQTGSKRSLVVCLALAGVWSLPGCSSTEAPRFALSGKVTYAGTPVPYGTITFTPHAEKGNPGTQGSGTIENGSYKTRSGYGTIGGPHIVRITAYDGKKPEGPEAPMMPHGRLLADYRIEIDLSKETTTRDFDILAQPEQP